MGFQFNVLREDLVRVLAAYQNITSGKGVLAILSNVLIEVKEDRLILTGTDLTVGLQVTIPAGVSKTGTITLPAKKLYQIAKESSSDTLAFQSCENEWIQITAGPSVYKLAGTDEGDFPQLPEHEDSTLVTIPSDTFWDLINKTLFSISQDDESVYSLTSALLEKETVGEETNLRLISSDGHRLTIMGKKIDASLEELNFSAAPLIPRRGAVEIKKFCEDHDQFQCGLEKKQLVLKGEDALLIVRLSEGDFPDYKEILQIIPRDNIIEIDRIRFLEALKRINLFTESLYSAVNVEIASGKLRVLSQNADFGSAKDEFDVAYEGKPLALCFNCKYFIDTLQAIEGQSIKAAIHSNESPCLITSDDDPDFFSIIMPMKMN